MTLPMSKGCATKRAVFEPNQRASTADSAVLSSRRGMPPQLEDIFVFFALIAEIRSAIENVVFVGEISLRFCFLGTFVKQLGVGVSVNCEFKGSQLDITTAKQAAAVALKAFEEFGVSAHCVTTMATFHRRGGTH